MMRKKKVTMTAERQPRTVSAQSNSGLADAAPAGASRSMPTRRSVLGAAAAAAFLPFARQRILVQRTASVTARDRLRPPVAAWDPARGILIRGATVVTMDTEHSVIHDGQVLVRSGQIAAVWQGRQPPAGLDVGNPSIIEAD